MRTSIIALVLGMLAVLPGQSADTVLVPTSSTWKYFIGTQEASTPVTSWRSNTFNDTSWLNGVMPIGYTSTPGAGTGYEASIATFINWPSPGATLYVRKTFDLPTLAGFVGLAVNVFCDDG